jgi:hypothetical protein
MADLQEITALELSKLGHRTVPGEDLDTILMRYLNLNYRIPPAKAWTVKQSKELTSKRLSKEIRVGLQQLIKKAESGKDLKPHLSTLIEKPDYKDLMFYDWGVFHFHLGTTPHPKRKGFTKRTDELLFAITDINTVVMYLIDIQPHKGGFTNQELLRIIEENWVEILEPYTIKGVVGLTYKASDDDIDSLRKANINTMLQTPGGRCLVQMGGGITVAGTSIKNRIEANQIIVNVQQLEKWFIQQQDTLGAYFKNKYGKEWNELKFKVKSFNSPVKIEELTTGEVIETST